MRKELLTRLPALVVLAATMMTTGCSTDDGESDYYAGVASADISASGPAPGLGGGGDGNTQAGIVTAGEWNDLRQWPFWSGLMQSQDFGDKPAYWQFYTNNRVAVSVSDTEGRPVVGADVALVRGDETLWQTKTDNRGEASLWAGLYQEETADSAALTVRIGTELMEGHPQVARWDSVAAAPVNRYVVTSTTDVKPQADIAFIVDATGSMADEINFLKSDLVDIIELGSDDDYRRYIPDCLPDAFTVKAFSEAARIEDGRARAVMKVMERRGVLRQLGKKGRAMTWGRV